MLNFLFFFQAEDGIRDLTVTGVQTCALPISHEMLARIAAARGDFVTARREAALSRSDFVLAQVLLAQNDPAGALTALQRIYTSSRAKKTPLPRGYFAVAGEVFYRLGRREEARLAFMQALQLHPEDQTSRKRLAKLRESRPSP